MADTEAEVLETVAAPEVEGTVTSTPETVPEKPEAETKEPEPRVFTQEELDAIVSRRLERAQRRWEREVAQRAIQQAPVVTNQPISADQFETTDAYLDAIAEQKAAQKLAEREHQRRQIEVTEAYSEREEEARAKYDDFEAVAYNPTLHVTDAMAEVIRESEIGPEVAYFLGSNPKEAERIARLSERVQAKEIGRIEAKLMADPPVKRTTSAPAPIRPVTAKVTGAPVLDTTDPRSIDAMSVSEWIEADRARQRKRLEARFR